MTTSVNNYLYSIIDTQSGIKRSVNSINEGGSWLFKQVDLFTSSAPLILLEGVDTEINIPFEDTGYSENHLIDLHYNFNSNLFLPQTVGDLYLTSFRGKAVSTHNFTHLHLKVNSPTVDYNPIEAETVIFSKNSGDVEFISTKFLIFISQDLVSNGLKFTAQSGGGNLELYDYSFTIVKLFSNKGKNL